MGERLILRLLVGGQRGELLSENCTLKEVVYRRLFVENILDEAGI